MAQVNTFKILTILITALTLISCLNNTAPEFKEEISVFAVLQQGVDQHYVFVYKTYADIEDLIEAEELFIKDAGVTIENSTQSINLSYYYDELRYINQSRYIDLEQKVIVKPGEKYTLTVKTGIGLLTGETIVPNPIKLLAPINGSTFKDRSILEISWEKDDTVYGYVIKLEGPPYEWEWREGTIYKGRDSFMFNTTDNSIQIPGKYIRYYEEHWRGQYIETDRRYTIKVMGFDKNFKQHQFDGYPIAGVENGYGVFGSVVIDSVDVFVVK